MSLPGYEVAVRIGRGSTGEVWRARDLSTGETVALRRLDEPLDPAAREALHRRAAVVDALSSPHLVRLRALVDDVLVLDHAPGGSLGDLLARRGHLSPGEVVTVVAPISSVLGAAHALGLAHGSVCAANVLLSADGMPMLAGLEWCSLLAPPAQDAPVAGGSSSASALDVWALAALCHHLLAGIPAAAPEGGSAAPAMPLSALAPEVPARLTGVVEEVLGAAPRHRPDTATFAALLRRSCPAVPVRHAAPSATRRGAAGPAAEPLGAQSAAGPVVVHDLPCGTRPASGAGSARHARRPSPAGRPVPVAGGRARALAAAIGTLVVSGALAGWAAGGGQLTAPSVLPPAAAGAAELERPAGPAPDWFTVLDRLDATREAAFAAGDPLLLAAVWAPGSAGLAADAAALEQLLAMGERAYGVRHVLRTVEVEEGPATGAAVRLAVVDELGEQEVRSATSAAVRQVPGRGPAAWQVRILRTTSGWRLDTVAPAPAPESSA